MYQDVDAMWEADAAAEWERLNAPDQYSEILKEAAKEMPKAIKSLDAAIDNLSDVSAIYSETPMQAKVDSFIDSLEDILYGLMRMKERWERGERE